MCQTASPCSSRQPAKLRFRFEKAHAEPLRGGWEKGAHAMRCREIGCSQVPGSWGRLAAPSPVWREEGPTLGAERQGRAEATALQELPPGSILQEPAGSVCLHTHLTHR